MKVIGDSIFKLNRVKIIYIEKKVIMLFLYQLLDLAVKLPYAITRNEFFLIVSSKLSSKSLIKFSKSSFV